MSLFMPFSICAIYCTLSVPDRRKIPERDILLETRRGVALSYAPAGIAV